MRAEYKRGGLMEVKLRTCFFFLFFAASLKTDAATAVWIDTDPSLGPPWREVDDAFALLLAFKSPELRIAGISTSYGNASVQRTTAVACDLTKRFGGTTRVYRGAASPAERGRETEASRALAETLRRESSLTYVALGPLTDLATLQQLHPQLARKIDRILILGGKSARGAIRLGPRGWPHVHDANIFKDPAAAEAVLHFGTPIALVPIEVAQRLTTSSADWREIEGGAAGEYLRPRTWAWRWFWTKFVGAKGAPVFDVLPIAAVLRPDLVSVKKRYASFDAQGELIFEAQPHSRDAIRVDVITNFDAKAKELFVRRLAQ
ncbi:MAG: nucleoside hydrolase [Verrucomicrobiota bacterium]|nr:nucleoside hydrolase [Verrucomicrobiota bacterium]